MIIKYIEVLILIIICYLSDRIVGKMKNKVTISFMIIGIITNSLIDGKRGSVNSIIGIIVPFIVFFIFFALKTIGSGDIKELMAIGAIMGYPFVINACFSVFSIALIEVVIKMVKEKTFMKRLRYFLNYVGDLFRFGYTEPYNDINNLDKKIIIRLGTAICLGTMINLILEYYGYYIFWEVI